MSMIYQPVRATGTVAPGAFGSVLRTVGGGEWDIGYSRKIQKLMGERVEIVGRRVGFNELICDEIWPVGLARPRRTTAGPELWLVAAVVAYGILANFKGLFD